MSEWRCVFCGAARPPGPIEKTCGERCPSPSAMAFGHYVGLRGLHLWSADNAMPGVEIPNEVLARLAVPGYPDPYDPEDDDL